MFGIVIQCPLDAVGSSARMSWGSFIHTMKFLDVAVIKRYSRMAQGRDTPEKVQP